MHRTHPRGIRIPRAGSDRLDIRPAPAPVPPPRTARRFTAHELESALRAAPAGDPPPVVRLFLDALDDLFSSDEVAFERTRHVARRVWPEAFDRRRLVPALVACVKVWAVTHERADLGISTEEEALVRRFSEREKPA